MNKIAKIMLGLLLSTVLVMSLIGCTNESETSTTPTTPTTATVPDVLIGTWNGTGGASLVFTTNGMTEIEKTDAKPRKYSVTKCTTLPNKPLEISIQLAEGFYPSTLTFTSDTKEAFVYGGSTYTKKQ